MVQKYTLTQSKIHGRIQALEKGEPTYEEIKHKCIIACKAYHTAICTNTSFIKEDTSAIELMSQFKDGSQLIQVSKLWVWIKADAFVRKHFM
jgi:hypothetical protein